MPRPRGGRPPGTSAAAAPGRPAPSAAARPARPARRRSDIDEYLSLGDREAAMPSRVQLALNVNDIDQAIAFYTKLFGTEPAKVRPGYVNFAIADPALKLV